MVNSKKVAASLPLPKKKKSAKSAVVEEVLKGSSHGKGKGKVVVSFRAGTLCPIFVLLLCLHSLFGIKCLFARSRV